MKRFTLSLLVLSLTLLLVVALLFSGCATTTTTTATETTTATTTATATKVPIKIGVAVPFSGYLAGDGLNAFQSVSFAVDKINAQGGLLGRPIQIVKYDNQDLSPERVTQGADTLVGQEKVDATFAGWAGFGGDVEAYGKYKAPFFMADSSEYAISIMKQGGYTNIWQCVDCEEGLARANWQGISTIPYNFPNKKLAIITADDEFGETLGNFIEEFAGEEGWQVVIREKVPYGTTEWSPVLTKIRSQQPSLIHFEMPSPPDMISFFEGFIENPSNSILCYGFGLSYRELEDILGSRADGTIGISPVTQGFPMPAASEAGNDWLQSWMEIYGTRPAGTAGDMYKGFMAWVQAVEAVGDPSDYDAINNYLGTHSFTIWEGIPAFKFNEDHYISGDDCPFCFGQIQDGHAVTISMNGEAYQDWEGKTYNFIVPSWIE